MDEEKERLSEEQVQAGDSLADGDVDETDDLGGLADEEEDEDQ